MAGGSVLGIVGVGNLGGALAQGALGCGAVRQVLAADLITERLRHLSDQIGAGFVPADLSEVARNAEILVLAVKPHGVAGVLAQVAPNLRPGCPVVSVAAGVRIGLIQRCLPPNWPVVRAMPNLAMLVQESATALTANPAVTDEQFEAVEAIFRSVGMAVRVSEDQMHAVTGLTGSGPAYVSLIIEGLAAGGVRKGLQPDLARQMACQLLYGTAKLLADTGTHPGALANQVTTPAGTTIAGLRELELRAVRGALLAAVEAASERSEELGQD